VTVEIRFLGHLGNNLFQYALGRVLAESLDQPLVYQPPASSGNWGQVERRSGVVDRLTEHLQAFPEIARLERGAAGDGEQIRYVYGEREDWNGQGVNLAYLQRAGVGRHIVLKGYFQRAELYHPHREAIRRWCRLEPQPDLPELGVRDVVVHVRRSLDMFLLDRALSLDYYRQALESLDPGRVFVVGLGIDERCRQTLAPFRPQYPELSAIATLALLSRAPRIVLANSTLSWWGAFLSDARRVCFPQPCRGFWGPDRPDVSLEVPDPRYHYVADAPMEQWRPFAPQPGVALRAEPEAAGSWLLVAASQGGSGRVRVAAELGGLCQWLEARREPFGPRDLDPLELAPAARLAALRLILGLCQRGALAAEAGAVEGLMTRYGAAGSSAETGTAS